MKKHNLNFTQFKNLIESGIYNAGFHPDDVSVGEWTIRDLYDKVDDLDIVTDICKSNIDGWNINTDLNDYDVYVKSVLRECTNVDAEKYINLPIFRPYLENFWKNYYNPYLWSVSDKIDKWIVLYKLGRTDMIGFAFN